MNIKRTSNGPRLRPAAFTLLLLWATITILNAQGYLYTFVGSGGSELDGSFIVLSNNMPGPPSLASLGAARILDSYGPGAVFDILAPPNSISGFAVTSFGPTGFSGSITCEMFGYLGVPSIVELSGDPSGIFYSRNLFFPGNPLGGAIFGTWVVTAIPEPSASPLTILGAIAICRCRWPRRRPSNVSIV